MVFIMSPFNDWVHFDINTCSKSQYWRFCERWKSVIMSPFSNWVDFTVNTSNMCQYWQSHQRDIVTSRCPFSGRVCFTKNACSKWESSKSGEKWIAFKVSHSPIEFNSGQILATCDSTEDHVWKKEILTEFHSALTSLQGKCSKHVTILKITSDKNDY